MLVSRRNVGFMSFSVIFFPQLLRIGNLERFYHWFSHLCLQEASGKVNLRQSLGFLGKCFLPNLRLRRVFQTSK